MYSFGNVLGERPDDDGVYHGECLLMNQENGLVLRRANRGGVVSLKELVQWFARMMANEAEDQSWNLRRFRDGTS